MPAHPGAHVIRDAIVKFGSTAYGNQCTKAQLTPDTPVQQIRTMVPDGAVSDTDSSTWVLELEGLQDHEAGGLADYLWDNRGTQQTVIVAPRAGSGKAQFTVTVIIPPPPIGGEQGEWAVMELEIPVIGEPVKGAQV